MVTVIVCRLKHFVPLLGFKALICIHRQIALQAETFPIDVICIKSDGFTMHQRNSISRRCSRYFSLTSRSHEYLKIELTLADNKRSATHLLISLDLPQVTELYCKNSIFFIIASFGLRLCTQSAWMHQQSGQKRYVMFEFNIELTIAQGSRVYADLSIQTLFLGSAIGIHILALMFYEQVAKYGFLNSGIQRVLFLYKLSTQAAACSWDAGVFIGIMTILFRTIMFYYNILELIIIKFKEI